MRLIIKRAMRLALGGPTALALLVGCQTVAPAPVPAPVDHAPTAADLTALEPAPAPPAMAAAPHLGATQAMYPAREPANDLSQGVRLATRLEPLDVEMLPMPERLGQTDDGPPLTLHELETIALSLNPAVAEAAARVQAVNGKYYQVGLPPNPTVGYVADDIGDEHTAGKQGGYISQQFITGHKLGLNREAAAWEVEQAEQQWAAQHQRVLTDVRVAYHNLLLAQDRLSVTRRLAQTSSQAVEVVNALLQVQETSGVELLQAKVEANTANLLVANAETNHRGAWRQLAAVMGNPNLPLRAVAGNAASDLPVIEFDEALARILAASPQLAALQAEVQRARWAVNRAQAEVIPNVTVQGTVQYDATTDLTVAGVQVGLPLPLVNRNQGGIQQAQGELLAAERAVERVELALQKKLAGVYQDYRAARQQVDQYSSEILPKVNESLRLNTEGFRAGEFNFLQLLTAQRTYFQSNLAYLNALRQMWTASHMIEGLLLDQSLETGAGSD